MADDCKEMKIWRRYERKTPPKPIERVISRTPDGAPPSQKPWEQIIAETTQIVDLQIEALNKIPAPDCSGSFCHLASIGPVSLSRLVPRIWRENYEALDAEGQVIHGHAQYRAWFTVVIATTLHICFREQDFGDPTAPFNKATLEAGVKFDPGIVADPSKPIDFGDPPGFAPLELDEDH